MKLKKKLNLQKKKDWQAARLGVSIIERFVQPMFGCIINPNNQKQFLGNRHDLVFG